MDALNSPFKFTFDKGSHSISLEKKRHFSMHMGVLEKRFGEKLTKRQIDLLRISMAIHCTDGCIQRSPSTNGLRSPFIDCEVLDATFWSQPETYIMLKKCVDFLSGGEDWSFRFSGSVDTRHDHQPSLFRGSNQSEIVALYSGGLDSAAGLASRLATERGRMVIPVNVRFQKQKAKLVNNHAEILIKKGLVAKENLKPFQAIAFKKNSQIDRDFGFQPRAATHRCRPFLFMSLAGLVAETVSSPEVEIFESGVGSLNLPLVSGASDYRTTRSTHPYFLRLMSELVSHVNESNVCFVLPFAHLTKAELVKRMKDLELEELARKSLSCILYPLLRKHGRQCGYCPACVYRRQAMIVAGIGENQNAYEIDLFSPFGDATQKQMATIRAFHQQAIRLAELSNKKFVPGYFRNYLYTTCAVSTDEELAPYIELYRRYQKEWADLIADARLQGFPWIESVHSLSCSQKASP